MTKPKTIAGYDDAVTADYERVLVMLLRGLGPWRDSIYLVGGLVPRYLVCARPPQVPPHAGTADVDVVAERFDNPSIGGNSTVARSYIPV